MEPEDCEPSTSKCYRTLRIGCALLPKKVQRYLTPKMIQTANSSGIDLCLIDYTRPLAEQGHFDAIIHKMRPNKDWERNLLGYVRDRPHVKVIDSVDGIRTLQNRATMLRPLQGVGIALQHQSGAKNGERTCTSARVQAPTQVEVQEGMSLDEVQALLASADLTPPLLVKPLWTDGREGSHGLAVLHDLQALGKLLQGSVSSELKPPLVVQQFVEHGGLIYKVYVLGGRTVVCRRPSLGDNYLGEEARMKGVLSLPRISCKSLYPKDSPEYKLSSQVVSCSSSGSTTSTSSTDSPPTWLTHALASALRSKLGLQLFNFDLICPEEQPPSECLYYVIDINYFPGVDKIPNFENIFVDFLLSACTGENGSPGENSEPEVSALSSEHVTTA